MTWDDLTSNQKEVLWSLAYNTDRNAIGHRGQGCFTPLDVGGHNGSHHSATLTASVKKGLAEHRKGLTWGVASTRVRGSKVYRASAAGLELWREHRRQTNRT